MSQGNGCLSLDSACCTVDFCNLFVYYVSFVNNRWNWVQYNEGPHTKQSLASWSFPFWGDVFAWSPSIIWYYVNRSELLMTRFWTNTDDMSRVWNVGRRMGRGWGGGGCRPLSCMSQLWGVMRGSCIFRIKVAWLKIIQIMDLELTFY